MKMESLERSEIAMIAGGGLSGFPIIITLLPVSGGTDVANPGPGGK